MKKLIYLFVMVAGMTLAAVNVNAQDATSKPKEATAACSKDSKKACCKDKAACAKDGKKACCKSGEKAACAKKDESKTKAKN